MQINFKALFTIILYLVVFLFLGFIYIQQHIADLEKMQYLSFVKQLQQSTEAMIIQKKEQNRLLAYSLSVNKEMKIALEEHLSQPMELSETLSNLESFTSLNDVWIGVVDKNDKILYQSWSHQDKEFVHGAYERFNMDNNPRIIEDIIEWRYNIASRVIVPIFQNRKPIGMIISLILVDHISLRLEKQGYSNIILLNKSKSDDKSIDISRLDRYYVAKNNQKVYQSFQHVDLYSLMHGKPYTIDKKHQRLLTKYVIKDKKKNHLGYILFSYPIEKIDLSYVHQLRNTLVVTLLVVLFAILLAMYYMYTIRYKKFLDAQSKLLTSKVDEKTKSLRYLATHDSLTKLPNRIKLESILDDYIMQAHGHPCSIYVMFLDLDRFKEINDTYGHSIGDGLLKQVSKRVQKLLDNENVFGRVSGDEFIIYIRNITEVELLYILGKIKRAMSRSFVVEDLELFITFSIGISHFPTNGSSAKVLLREADTAMYEAKNKGKNNYQFYQPMMTAKILKRQELGRELRHALTNGEFEVCYQPKTDIQTGKILGLEGLIRWEHPEKGLLSPSEFIELAEEIGLIIQIDEYVRNMAFKQLVQWKKMGLETGVLSLNISTKELESNYFYDTLMLTMQSTGMDSKDLELEVLENQIMKNQKHIIGVLQQMRAQGINIAIDDFGTGYSSLSYLHKLPIDTLKIDQSFIKNLEEGDGSLEIVRTIISLSKTLGLKVIAEGVESKYHVDILLKEGCHHIQGYYFSKPLPPEDCQRFLTKMMKGGVEKDSLWHYKLD